MQTPDREHEAIGSWAVRVSARPDELLLGLMLNADRANGLVAGSTGMMTRRHETSTRRFGQTAFSVLGTSFDLAAIATLLSLNPGEVERSTFIEPLRRMFGSNVTTRKLGSTGLRVCPSCLNEGWMIRRDAILPLIHGCPVHGQWLVTRCRCGRPLDAFSGFAPFTCECGEAWSSLSSIRLAPRDALRQRRVVHAYRLILERGDARLEERARRVLSLDPGRRWDHGWCASDDYEIEHYGMAGKDVKSLASIVANLVLRQIPPERLFERLPVGRHPLLVCHNEACPTFKSSTAMRVSAERSNGLESYCAECGSRYLGNRMILSFDRNHGSPDLNRIVVSVARARLADYGARLAAACDFLMADKDRNVARRIYIDHVFHMAGVPMSSHLRARRIGLVALVQQRLGTTPRQLPTVILDPEFPAVDASGRWRFPIASASVATDAEVRTRDLRSRTVPIAGR